MLNERHRRLLPHLIEQLIVRLDVVGVVHVEPPHALIRLLVVLLNVTVVLRYRPQGLLYSLRQIVLLVVVPAVLPWCQLNRHMIS